MKETGIIMSGNHPKLILDGIKTMTRRTWGLEEINKSPDRYSNPDVYEGITGEWFAWFHDKQSGNPMVVKCPYGGVGDRLWVRATWAKNYKGQMLFKYQYENLTEMLDLPTINIKWQPSIHLFKEDAEIWLEITELRAERLQEITEEDAQAEGIVYQTDKGNNIFWYEVCGEYHGKTQAVTASQSFENLWNFLNAKRGHGWDKNDWVWPIGFQLIN